LTVRLRYDTSSSSWVFMNYFANDSETRYVAIGNPNPTYYANQAAFPSATDYHGGVAHSHADGAMYYAHGGNWIEMAKDSDVTTNATAIGTKLPLAGGTLTGDLTLSGNPTAANHAANKSYVDTEVAGIVSSAPATLDTLNELAAALGDDPNFATTVTNSIGTKLPLAGGTLTGGLTGTTGTFVGVGELVLSQSTVGQSATLFLGKGGPSKVFSVDESGNLKIGSNIDSAGTTYISLNTTGSATFAGNVDVKRVATDVTGGGVLSRRDDTTDHVWRGYLGTVANPENSLTSEIFADGSASFAGSMTVSGTGQYTGGQRGAVTTLTDAGAIYPNFAAANNFTLTIAGNRTIHNPTNQTAGQHGVIRINQDGTGGRVPAFASNWKFPGGTAPTFSTAANAQDLLAYYVAASGTILAQLITDLK